MAQRQWCGIFYNNECFRYVQNSQKLWSESAAKPRFQSWGSIPWSRVLLPFYRKKLDRSIRFGAVGYIITPYSSKNYVKSWGSVQILGRSGPMDANCTFQFAPAVCRVSFWLNKLEKLFVVGPKRSCLFLLAVRLFSIQ